MNIDILSESDVSHLKELIETSEKIIICCHHNPDGDAIGSSLGWAQYLRTCGKEAKVIVPDAYPDFLQWLPNTEKIIRFDKKKDEVKALFADAQLIFCLDFNNADRMEEELGAVLTASKAKKVLIDHHPSPDIDVENMCFSSRNEFHFRTHFPHNLAVRWILHHEQTFRCSNLLWHDD
jgi:phosphoesterase RecJ-like protein